VFHNICMGKSAHRIFSSTQKKKRVRNHKKEYAITK
jgi:hypothetical protein